jgi:hypothetical protein
MDRTTLDQRLQEVETTLQRLEENIAFQGRMIATLDRGSHDDSWTTGSDKMPEIDAETVTSIIRAVSTDDGNHVLLKLDLSGQEIVLAIPKHLLPGLLNLVSDSIAVVNG